MLKKHLPIFALLFILFPGQDSNYWQSRKYADLINDLEKIGFSKDTIASIFSNSQINFYPDILKKLKGARVPKLTGPDSKLLSEKEINKGKNFIQKNRTTLERIEKEYRVEKEVITAILRIESDFGQNLGAHQAFGALNSIILYSEADSDLNKWAKKEMIAFMTIYKGLGENLFELKASVAGAIGISQFLPTSCLKFGIDGNQDGRIDLFNLEDAVCSIANYLIKNGWENSRSKAIYSYNHNLNYVEGVEAYAKKLQDDK